MSKEIKDSIKKRTLSDALLELAQFVITVCALAGAAVCGGLFSLRGFIIAYESGVLASDPISVYLSLSTLSVILGFMVLGVCELVDSRHGGGLWKRTK